MAISRAYVPVPAPSWRALSGLVLAAIMLLGTPPLSAQETPQPVPADSAASRPGVVSPRGAFLRAVLLPGWGHASIGSYKRAAFYLTVEGATAWALVKARHRFGEAQDRIVIREDFLRRELEDQGVTDPEEIQAALDDDAALQDLTALEESRRQQKEDWTALGIFLMFLSGADAFVSAHLKDFPAPIQVNAQPVGNGRMELSVGITLPR